MDGDLAQAFGAGADPGIGAELDWRDVRDGGFNSHMGPIMFARAGEGRWLGRLEIQPKHINFGGVAHGGVYMALADVTMGIGAHDAADRQRSATIDFSAQFLAAAKAGQWLICDARLNRAVSGVVFMESDLWAGGRRCMRATGIWKVLSLGRRPPEEP